MNLSRRTLALFTILITVFVIAGCTQPMNQSDQSPFGQQTGDGSIMDQEFRSVVSCADVGSTDITVSRDGQQVTIDGTVLVEGTQYDADSDISVDEENKVVTVTINVDKQGAQGQGTNCESAADVEQTLKMAEGTWKFDVETLKDGEMQRRSERTVHTKKASTNDGSLQLLVSDQPTVIDRFDSLEVSFSEARVFTTGASEDTGDTGDTTTGDGMDTGTRDGTMGSCAGDVAAARAASEENTCTQQVQTLACPGDDGYTYTATDGCEATELKERGWTAAEDSGSSDTGTGSKGHGEKVISRSDLDAPTIKTTLHLSQQLYDKHGHVPDSEAAKYLANALDDAGYNYEIGYNYEPKHPPDQSTQCNAAFKWWGVQVTQGRLHQDSGYAVQVSPDQFRKDSNVLMVDSGGGGCGYIGGKIAVKGANGINEAQEWRRSGHNSDDYLRHLHATLHEIGHNLGISHDDAGMTWNENGEFHRTPMGIPGNTNLCGEMNEKKDVDFNGKIVHTLYSDCTAQHFEVESQPYSEGDSTSETNESTEDRLLGTDHLTGASTADDGDTSYNEKTLEIQGDNQKSGDQTSNGQESGDEESGDQEGFETYDLNGKTVDLTEVTGTKATELVEGPLPEGTYTKVELHVDDVEGVVNGEEVDVTVPSEKLQIVKPFDITAGEQTSFVFDISVVEKGAGGYNLLPVVGKSGVAGEDVEVDVSDEDLPRDEQPDRSTGQDDEADDGIEDKTSSSGDGTDTTGSCAGDVAAARAASEENTCTQQVQTLACPGDDGYTYTATDGCEVTELKERGWTAAEDSAYNDTASEDSTSEGSTDDTTSSTGTYDYGPQNKDAWALAFEDDFDGSSLNTDKWTVGFGWGKTTTASAERITADEVDVRDSDLVLTASHSGDDVTAGAVNTRDKHYYGPGSYWEARIKHPKREGFLPAFWSKPNSEAWPPEIDFSELFQDGTGSDDWTTANYNVHYSTSTDPGDSSTHAKSPTHHSTGTDLTESYHVYGAKWLDDRVEFYFDGEKVGETTDQTAMTALQNGAPFYMMLNIHIDKVGTTDRSVTWNEEMRVDWVRVWEHGDG